MFLSLVCVSLAHILQLVLLDGCGMGAAASVRPLRASRVLAGDVAMAGYGPLRLWVPSFFGVSERRRALAGMNLSTGLVEM